MKFLKSKGQTLIFLKNKKINIPKIILINIDDYTKNKQRFLSLISKKFINQKIAIRSSSIDEDTDKTSNAGKFISYLNVSSNDKNRVLTCINEVIKSYKKNSKKNEIIIQEMVKNVRLSGVYTTIDIYNYLPIININYDESSDTTSVTSGTKNSKTLFIFDSELKKVKKKKFDKLVTLVNKICKILKNNYLDLEFAIDKKGKVFILQARPIIIPKNKKIFSKIEYARLMQNLEKKVIKLQKKNYDLLGDTNCFGVMPDWNPAEIIGIKPKPLSLSLYKELITDHIWAKNRKNYGFQDLESHQLMTVFYGTPFIDVRVDFNSWIPQSLNKKTSKKLVNFYLKKLIKNKYLHDKVEFKILFTCLTLNTEDRLKKELKEFSKKEISEIKRSLVEINKIAFYNSKLDFQKLKTLEIRNKELESSKIYFLNKIYYLVEDCKKFGTLPFAGLARCGFIAIDILNSFVEKKIISEKEKIKFLSSINGVTSNLNSDLKNKNKKDFLEKYGHLRPNTYDITSLSYKEGFNKYFQNINEKTLVKKSTFNFKKKQKIQIEKFLDANGIEISFKKFVLFIKESVYNREYAKLIFTKSIDLIFSNLIKFGRKHGINRSDLAYIDINSILALHYNLNASSVISEIKNKIKINKLNYAKNSFINLPDTISEPDDLYYNFKSLNNGNYITQKKISAKTVIYNKNIHGKNLSKKIILIENADPGFDFLFSQKISGIITKYGGQNSHMSIRAAELLLPACIGVGEEKFNQISGKKVITIDCLNKKIY